MNNTIRYAIILGSITIFHYSSMQLGDYARVTNKKVSSKNRETQATLLPSHTSYINYTSLLQGLLFQGTINKIITGSFNIQGLLISTLISQAIQLAPVEALLEKVPYFRSMQQGMKSQISKIPYLGSQISSFSKNVFTNMTVNRLTQGQWNAYGTIYSSLKNVIIGLILQKILNANMPSLEKLNPENKKSPISSINNVTQNPLARAPQ